MLSRLFILGSRSEKKGCWRRAATARLPRG